MEIKELEELKKLQKQEAIERLKILEKEYKLHKNVLREFKTDETIYYSETVNKFFSGILYWLHNEQKYIDKVKEIEQRYNIYVYHCILTHTEVGDCLIMLYISSDKENWENERNQLVNDSYVDSYVWNVDCEYYSEFGLVGIKGVNGGLVRTF